MPLPREEDERGGRDELLQRPPARVPPAPAERGGGRVEHAAVGDVDALALVRDDDHRPAQRHVAPEVHVTGHREMVELEDLGDLLEPLLELLDLKKSETCVGNCTYPIDQVKRLDMHIPS